MNHTPKPSSFTERPALQRAARHPKVRQRVHGHRSEQQLRFTPTAWAKLVFLRDAGDTEVGGFGISSAEDLLLVEDVCLVRQACSAVTVAFDDEAVADFFDRQVDLGRPPAQFGRIWIHTHPGSSPTPSSTDEETFARVFGRTDWALMFILASEGATYARLRFNTGPGGSLLLPTAVDYSRSFSAADHEAWLAEYIACVRDEGLLMPLMEDWFPMEFFPGEPGQTTQRHWPETWDEPLPFDEELLLLEEDLYDPAK